MFATLARRTLITVPRTVTTIPSILSSVLSRGSQPLERGNLYQILSQHVDGGIGREVSQVRWSIKNRKDTYWVVTRAKFKLGGKHGKAWGQFYYKGKLKTTPGTDEEIRGGLKYSWREGRSTRTIQPPKS
ncbi:hypothetical protein DL96DRAFT_1593702 [Flagelloscypha sp. PMI_526]|nr:hypothetical protein DL96DRAFT_1593702 [Flagelloscypha sp. PMI_526]